MFIPSNRTPNQRKNRATPITLITEPMTSLVVILCFSKRTEGGMIRMGTMAMIVEATPVEV